MFFLIEYSKSRKRYKYGGSDKIIYMKELRQISHQKLIIIKTANAEKIRCFLDQEKEISLLDQAQEEDDEENTDWEWYDN